MINVPSLQNNYIVVHSKALDLDKTRPQIVAEKLGQKQIGLKGREKGGQWPCEGNVGSTKQLSSSDHDI